MRIALEGGGAATQRTVSVVVVEQQEEEEEYREKKIGGQGRVTQKGILEGNLRGGRQVLGRGEEGAGGGK